MTIPHLARYSPLSVGDALIIVLVVGHPAVKAASGAYRVRPPRSEPPISFGLIGKLGDTSYNAPRGIEGKRLEVSLLLLMIYASLRLSDTKDVADIWTSGSAVCGVSLYRETKAGTSTIWSTPTRGCSSEDDWANPLLKFRDKFKPTQTKGGWAKFQIRSSAICEMVEAELLQSRRRRNNACVFGETREGIRLKNSVRTTLPTDMVRHVCEPTNVQTRGSRRTRALGSRVVNSG